MGIRDKRVMEAVGYLPAWVARLCVACALTKR